MNTTVRCASVRSAASALVGVLAGCAAVVLVAACSSASSTRSGAPQSVSALVGRQAPASWHRATLPGGAAVLAFPPAMHLVEGDAGTVTAAETAPSGRYLLYLNVTPRQSTESLADWVQFRLEHQRDDDARTARELSQQTGVRFLGGTGTCVTDAYVTRVDAHHFTEIACFVQGKTSANVIVAAAPTANWGSASSVLRRAIAGFVVR